MKNLQYIGTDDMDIHIICAGLTYGSEQDNLLDLSEQDDLSHLYPFHLYTVIYQMMQKYDMKSLLLTAITMFKGQLVTKELVKDVYQGRIEFEGEFTLGKTSVEDDLEFIFEQIKLGNESFTDDFESTVLQGPEKFYFAKLTDEEMILLNNKDEDYLRTFLVYPYENPDVDEDEMELSESKSKFALYFCVRISIRLTL